MAAGEKAEGDDAHYTSRLKRGPRSRRVINRVTESDTTVWLRVHASLLLSSFLPPPLAVFFPPRVDNRPPSNRRHADSLDRSSIVSRSLLERKRETERELEQNFTCQAFFADSSFHLRDTMGPRVPICIEIAGTEDSNLWRGGIERGAGKLALHTCRGHSIDYNSRLRVGLLLWKNLSIFFFRSSFRRRFWLVWSVEWFWF